MRRTLIVAVMVVVSFMGAAFASQRALAQDDNTTPEAEMAVAVTHPAVGTWITTEPDTTPSITTIFEDGNATDTQLGQQLAGTWEATGDNTVNLTMAGFVAFEGFEGYVVIHAEATISEDGESFDAPYAYTVVAADGTVVDSGEGHVIGVRLQAAGMDAAGSALPGMPTWIPESATGDDDVDDGDDDDAQVTVEATVEDDDDGDATPVP